MKFTSVALSEDDAKTIARLGEVLGLSGVGVVHRALMLMSLALANSDASRTVQIARSGKTIPFQLKP